MYMTAHFLNRGLTLPKIKNGELGLSHSELSTYYWNSFLTLLHHSINIASRLIYILRLFVASLSAAFLSKILNK